MISPVNNTVAKTMFAHGQTSQYSSGDVFHKVNNYLKHNTFSEKT